MELIFLKSNIVGKYQDLESLKMDIEEGILVSAENVNKTKTLAMVAMILSQLILIFSIVGLFIKKKLVTKGLGEVESLVKNNVDKAEHHILAQQVFKKMFKALEVPKNS